MKLSEALDTRDAVVTQDFYAHVQTALRNGWCYQPGPCPGGIYYYGGIDWGFVTNKTPRIWAAQSGLVSRVYDQPNGYGNGVQIAHDNGWATVYAHLSRIDVKVGQRVSIGQALGLGGGTGKSTGPHLHFELRNEKGIPIDPMPYFLDVLADEFDIPELPALKKAKIITPVLMIRELPATGATPIVGRLYQGVEVSVIGVEQREGNVWLQIGHQQYCAAKFGRAIYAEWV